MNKLAQLQMIMIGWTIIKIAFVTYFAMLNPWYVIPAYILVEFATSTIIPIPHKKEKKELSSLENRQGSNNKWSVNRDTDTHKKTHETQAPTQHTASAEMKSATEPHKKKSGHKRSMGGNKSTGIKKPYKKKAPKTN